MATLRLDGEAAPSGAPNANEEITLVQWKEGVRPEAAHFALFIPNTEDIAPLADAVSSAAAIILTFPTFMDGRAYSQARMLRERFGFRGEIRARGAIVPDQALFMARAGFTTLEIGDADPAPFLDALAAYSVFYQYAADAALPAHHLRARRREAA